MSTMKKITIFGLTLVLSILLFIPVRYASAASIQPNDTNIQSISIGDTLTFGNYRQYWTHDGYLASPIEWRVLNIQDGNALLISSKVLDHHAYHTSKTATTWETCDLRYWLNHTFLNKAFTEQEQQAIVYSLVPAQDNPLHPEKQPVIGNGNDTYDYVFILNAVEALEYFSDDYDRIAEATGYAVNQGVSTANGSAATGYRIGKSNWMLRQPHTHNVETPCVDFHGNMTYGVNVTNERSGVRPCIWVDLSALNLTSGNDGASSIQKWSQVSVTETELSRGWEKSISTSGVSATAKAVLPLYTGPGTDYVYIGKYFASGDSVRAISLAYDDLGAAWCMVDGWDGSAHCRGYVLLSKLDVNKNDLVQELDSTQWTSGMAADFYDNSKLKIGPGDDYSALNINVVNHWENMLIATEGEWAQVELADQTPKCRVWVKMSSLMY